MTPELLRRVAFVHGVLAWIAAACLAAIALWLHRRRDEPASRALRVASALVTSLVAATFGAGALLEMPYRVHLRQRLFLASRALGWLFESKSHFSFGALAFSLLALLALLAAGDGVSDPAPRALRRASRLGYAAALLFVILACVIGSVVAARAGSIVS